MISVRKQWVRIILVISGLIILINSLFISLFVTTTFNDFLSTEYKYNIQQLEEFSIRAIDDEYPRYLINVELRSRLADPIYEIMLFDGDGDLITSAVSDAAIDYKYGFKQVSKSLYDNDGEYLGYLVVNVVGNVVYFEASKAFIEQLIIVNVLGFIFIGLLAYLVTNFIAKRTSKELEGIARNALLIDKGEAKFNKLSNINEIKTIQLALSDFDTKLKLKASSRKQLVDELIHQTRTPLTILKSHVEAYQDGIISMDEYEVKIFLEQISQIESIISNIGSMIETSNEQTKLNLECFEIDDLIANVVLGMKLSFEKHDISLITTLVKAKVVSDQYLLTQVFYNLLTNTLKYSPEQTKVEVSTYTDKTNYYIVIKDEGYGISEEQLPYIFDAYYQVDPKQKGEGIGLYVVKANLALLNASIKVDSKLGEGTTFTISLPKTNNC